MDGGSLQYSVEKEYVGSDFLRGLLDGYCICVATPLDTNYFIKNSMWMDGWMGGYTFLWKAHSTKYSE